MRGVSAAQERRDRIQRLVQLQGEATFRALAGAFQVSEMTIRRDVRVLEGGGLLRRVSGGAIASTSKTFEPAFSARSTMGAAQKARIAIAAVRLVRDGETVILDTGSTVLAVARALKLSPLSVHVLTNSLACALELAEAERISVTVTGGDVRRGELDLVGPDALLTLAGYNCDVYVMGVAGIDAERGFSEHHVGEAEVKMAALAAADRVIVVADKSKLDRVAFRTIARLDAVDVLVTDGSPDHPVLVSAREMGVHVVVVDETPDTAGDALP